MISELYGAIEIELMISHKAEQWEWGLRFRMNHDPGTKVAQKSLLNIFPVKKAVKNFKNRRERIVKFFIRISARCSLT